MEIIQRGEYDGDIISTTLSNRSINDLETFLNPSDSHDSDPLDFSGTEFGRKLLAEHILNDSLIAILIDADADGYTSAAVLYRYLKRIAPSIKLEYIIHEDKAHGLTSTVLNKVIAMNPNLLLIPDAGSNDVAQIEMLEEKDINVIVLDHHVVTEFTEVGHIINNQLCPMTNHKLVGVGVVYKFIQGIDIENGYSFADDYLDLVAIGQIGDASDISDPEIRNLVMTGLENITNPFLKVTIGEKIGLVNSLSPKDMSFNVIPIINAVTRVGTIEERSILFEGLAGIGDDRVFTVEKKKKNKTTGKFDKVSFNFNIYQQAYDLCLKAKSRQDSAVKKMTAQLQDSVVDDAGIIIAFSDNNDNPGITGLIANKLMSKFDKPTLLLNEKENNYTGSGRGHEGVLEDFRAWCEDSKLIDFASGHDNAFGISIPKDNLSSFKEYSRNIKKQKVIYEVDVLTDKPNVKDCEIVEKNKKLFGGSVSEPMIGILNMEVPKRFLSPKGQMLTIYSWGVSMVQFSANQEMVEKMMNAPGDNIRINVVGFYSMNNWSGRKIPQMIIKDIELIEEIEEEVTEENIMF